MTLFAGIDGGGTHTRAVVVDSEGRELARGEAEGAVVGVDSAPVVRDRVTRALARALEGVGSAPVEHLWAGLAGAGREEARQAVARELEAAGCASRVTVSSDVEAAFHDAFGDRAGILLIAGTGSIAWARTEDGTVLRVGGWGECLGDEGSGYAVGLAALRAVTHADDGRGPATALAGLVLERLGMERSAELIAWTSRASKGDVAALVPLVGRAGAEGDEVAVAILDAAVADLSLHVAAVLRRGGPWAEPPELVTWGGLLRDGGVLVGRIEEALASHPVRFSARPIDPAMGAARLALEA